MGLLTGVLGAPFAPARLAVSLAERLRRLADEQLHDPEAIRAELQEIARRRADATITDEAASAMEDDLLTRAMARPVRPGGG